MTSLRYTKLECSSKDVFRPPSINFLSFSFLFFWRCVLGGGGGGIRNNLILVHIGEIGEWTFVGVQRPEQNNVSVD